MEKKTAKIDYKLINKSELARRVGISQTYAHLLINGKITGTTGKRADYWLKKIEEVAAELRA